MGETPQQGVWKIQKWWLDFLYRKLSNCATSGGACLGVWNSNSYFSEGPPMAPPQGLLLLKKENKINTKKWKPSGGSRMAPPQKRFWGVKLETVGACHVAPTLRSSWHMSEGQEWKKQNAPPQRRAFSAGKERLTCGASSGWLHIDMCQENRSWRKQNDAHLRGELVSTFSECREVWTCGSSGWFCFWQVSAGWRGLLKWRHLRGKFEIQMGVGLEEWRVDMWRLLQGGSHSAMWQEARKRRERDTWRLHRPYGKGIIQDLRHLGPCSNFWMVCFFWRRPRVTCVTYFFWRRVEKWHHVILTFSEGS